MGFPKTLAHRGMFEPRGRPIGKWKKSCLLLRLGLAYEPPEDATTAVDVLLLKTLLQSSNQAVANVLHCFDSALSGEKAEKD